jgi:hypothetical protein
LPIQIEEHADSDDSGDETSKDLTETGADEISNSLCVVHDPRDELSALCRIEIRDGESLDVPLHTHSHIRDGELRGDAEYLRQGE